MRIVGATGKVRIGPEEKTRLERFLEFQTAQATRKTYTGGLRKFFATIYPDLPLEEAAEQYFDKERDYEEDVRQFFLSIREMAPASVRTHLAATRAFLEENRVIIPSAWWRRLGRKKRGGKVTMDRYPTDEELVRIFEHLPLHGKALFHLLATSGIRIGTALQLRRNDIHLNTDHVQITVRGEYEKEATSFIAFASEETKELMEEWLRVRGNYLTSAVNRSRYRGKDANDDRVFPMHGATANKLWRKALVDTGLDEKDPNTGWTVLHPHTLRQRVRSKMAEAGIPSDIAEALIGHRTYLDEYKKWDVVTMLRFYKKAEHLLIPSGVARTVKELDEKMERENKELQFQVDLLTQDWTRLTTENTDLKKQVNALFVLVGGKTKMTGQERFDAEMTDEAKAEFRKLKKKVLR